MPARILVVDDQPLNIKVLEAKLSSEYYEVIAATDGAGALAAMREEKPDIVLLDIMMPGMDGFEVCRQMKADPDLAHIPVIVITALSEASDRVRGLEAGADDFLTKPINEIAMFARVRSLLRLKLALDELRLRDHTSLQLGVADGLVAANDGGAKARILLVEDSLKDADLIRDVLSREHEVVHVADTETALQTASVESFDVVIVSVELKDSDGLRLCSQLRSRDVTRNVPLLALIAENATSKLAKALDLGVSDYLYKPVDTNELIARTRNQIRHKRYQDRLRKTYERSVSLAVTDTLTGLYNRLYLTSHLGSLLERITDEDKPLAIAMIDVDHFKDVNDRYGHAVGDEVLREIAERLSRFTRATDLLARLGGEEFVIVMPETTVEAAQMVTARLRREVAAAPFWKTPVDGGLAITVSIGVAAMLGSNDTPEDLLKRADDALYAAKRGGRNRVIATAR
ncbi:MAG: PleD family two-component system response regulator [Alphaproteobacteria bacterium]